jgi:YfiH family protein
MIELSVGAARVAFSTREGGVSKGPYESLNLGILTEDDPQAVAENRARLAGQAGVDAAMAMGRQVHGTDIKHWTGSPGAPLEEVDGHSTSLPGLALTVLAADCYPVALAAEDRVAMLHCGWRGLAGGIIERGAEGFDAPPVAVVGPGIGACCYEVGDEVSRAFEGIPGALAGRMLDLRAVADHLLRATGIEDVRHVDLCTSCRSDLFFSHRRDQGVTGRQAGLVWLEKT